MLKAEPLTVSELLLRVACFPRCRTWECRILLVNEPVLKDSPHQQASSVGCLLVTLVYSSESVANTECLLFSLSSELVANTEHT